MSNKDITKNLGWTQAPAKVKQPLPPTIHPPCYSYSQYMLNTTIYTNTNNLNKTWATKLDISTCFYCLADAKKAMRKRGDLILIRLFILHSIVISYCSILHSAKDEHNNISEYLINLLSSISVLCEHKYNIQIINQTHLS